jgi:hypothetical protein
VGTLSFAAKPVLTGNLVTLRPVRAADAARLLVIDEETRRLTGSFEDPDWIDCQLAVVPGMDHLPPLRDPALVLTSVTTTLSRASW